MITDLENAEIELLRKKLQDANDTIEAIRRGEIDALVIKGKHGHEVYTLESADHAYRVFLEKMTEGAVTLDEQGVIQYSNSSFAAMVRLTSALVVAEQFSDFVAEKDREFFTNLVERGWRTDVKGEVQLVSHGGSMPVQLSISALKLGKHISLSILITDLSEQKEVQALLKLKNDQLAVSNLALEASNLDLQQFASVASHDLQEPLRKILTFATKLKENHIRELSEVPLLCLEKILASASRMKLLIVDILNYSNLTGQDSKFVSTDMKGLIVGLLEDFEMTIKETNAVIVVEDLPALPVIQDQMRQVFNNLISNALKFSGKGTIPMIDIYSTDDVEDFLNMTGYTTKFCHIHVKDNGIGVEEEYTKDIFNLFVKLNSKADYEGTGIGLAICKKIVEKHHGQISIRSKPGLGSDFIVSLPIEQPPARTTL